MTRPACGFLAIDVGSSRVKLGWFPPPGECTSELKPSVLPIAAPQLPQPEETLTVAHHDVDDVNSTVDAWLNQLNVTKPQAFAASVHPVALASLEQLFSCNLRVLSAEDLPIELRVNQPERVGIDRLLNAVAVNRLRPHNRPAIVVDVGTACTVDLLAVDGGFEGGAILPGVTLAAKSLHAGTASLPQLTSEMFDPPPPVVGKSTESAIAAGLYWGLVGAIRELIHRMSSTQAKTPQLYLTGGGASQLVEHLSNELDSLRHISSLVLAGIAIAAEELS